MASHESIVAAKRAERERRIPQSWRLPREIINQFSAQPITIFQQPIPREVSPGILSSRELELTDPKLDATALLSRLRSGSVSCYELTLAFCKRAAIAHQLTNCLTEILFEQAINKARQCDGEFRENGGRDLKPLHGLPMTFKDSFHIKGVESSIGITSLCHKLAISDSQVVEIAEDNRAVIVAKTTVPQTLLTADTDSVVFGRTCNAYRGNFGAAGSTGGEGALIAMGGSPLGVGTDGAGSVRMPAFVNGIVGYRPSGYRFPLDGVRVLGSGLMGSTMIGPVSVAGPLARSMRDIQLFTEVVSDARPWDKDPFLLPSPWLGLEAPSKPLRIGVWQDHDHVHPTPPVSRAFKLAQERLQSAGHTLVPFNGPSIAQVWDLQKQWVEVQDLRHMRKLISSEPTTTIVKKTGILYPPNPAPEVTLDRLHYLNSRIAQLVVSMTTAWNRNGEPIDTLLWVPAAHPAVPFDEYTDLTFTGLMNVIDWPAVVLPLKEFVSSSDVKEDSVPESELFGEEDKRIQELWMQRREEFVGLPLSVQLIGRRGEDERLLAVAKIVHEVVSASQTMSA
ncbi:hypothetical protein PMZ80_000841 [Knufia obscura]|uniref:Amidase domain-containing protein n=2 Tax=Knufia TaxID=430999 RepID=A0AAN8I4G2_9EURO|nr:hypothetical protein PMZ80_000841 [Knufia obscura]KAK5949895.1 hypothetical protein OHC33_009080 [Knufia fluminis]